ncbi:MAG TPA: glycosyltransferase family 39 protein, partial [Bryobacteraceae bacterium]|nr:glycosyltransferase family 39 protein [Bryobacteraceae bacterium]
MATCWALGAILFRRLSLEFSRMEWHCLAFVVGSGCLSAIDFALAATHLVHRGVVLAIGIVSVGCALFLGAHRSSGTEFAPLARIWKWGFVGVFSIFTVLYFFNAMAPEMSPDGMAYHLGEVAKYNRAHGFVRITTNIYSNLSQGIELLFLNAFVYGRHSAAALVHFAYLVSLALLILCYGRRIGHPVVGVSAALFGYCSPIVGQDGTVAYNDVAIAAILFALFYLLQVWDQDRTTNLLAPIGILIGFSFAAKYTAFLAVPYALGFIVWKLWRARQPVMRPVLVVSLLALLFIAPWLLKNWMWVDNPVSPFANRLFPNPFVHVSFEEGYLKALRSYGLASYGQIPLQLTVRGDLLAGFFGPLFLLTPLALLSLRFRAGRQLLLAAVIFALPYAANVGTRFLIPAAPFLSLSLALAFANLEWL